MSNSQTIRYPKTNVDFMDQAAKDAFSRIKGSNNPDLIKKAMDFINDTKEIALDVLLDELETLQMQVAIQADAQPKGLFKKKDPALINRINTLKKDVDICLAAWHYQRTGEHFNGKDAPIAPTLHTQGTDGPTIKRRNELTQGNTWKISKQTLKNGILLSEIALLFKNRFKTKRPSLKNIHLDGLNQTEIHSVDKAIRAHNRWFSRKNTKENAKFIEPEQIKIDNFADKDAEKIVIPFNGVKALDLTDINAPMIGRVEIPESAKELDVKLSFIDHKRLSFSECDCEKLAIHVGTAKNLTNILIPSQVKDLNLDINGVKWDKMEKIDLSKCTTLEHLKLDDDMAEQAKPEFLKTWEERLILPKGKSLKDLLGIKEPEKEVVKPKEPETVQKAKTPPEELSIATPRTK